MSSVCPAGTLRMKVQGSASAGPRPSSSASGCAVANASRRARGSGVVGAAGGELGQRLGERAEEGLALGPGGVGDHEASRDAVEAGVVDQHGGHVLGLVTQIGHRPLAGHDDDRRHVAEFGAHRLVERGLVGRLAPGGVGAGAEDDGVVGLVRAGDVHRIDLRVPGQVLAHRSTAVDDAQHAGLDQRGQGAVPVRHQVVVHRVRLHHDDLALDEELGEHVARAERGHVASGKHQRSAGVTLGIGVGGGLAGNKGAAGDARLHDHLGRGLGEGDLVEGAGRQHPDVQAPVGALADRARDVRLAAPGDGAQRVAEEPGHAHEGADAGKQLLAGFGRTRSEALGGAGVSQPVVLGSQGVRDDAATGDRPGRRHRSWPSRERDRPPGRRPRSAQPDQVPVRRLRWLPPPPAAGRADRPLEPRPPGS